MEKDVGYLIKSISDRLKVKADAEFKQYHLTMAQCRVLTYLSSRGSQATQKEIEVFLGVSHPTVVGIVSRMEQNGYVTSWPSEDNRNKEVKLTPKAESVDTIMRQNMYNSEQMLLAPLSEKQRGQLRELLLLIAENLESTIHE